MVPPTSLIEACTHYNEENELFGMNRKEGNWTWEPKSSIIHMVHEHVTITSHLKNLK
jgi:hypothetical protein